MFTLIGRLNGDGLAILLVEQNVVQSLAIAHRAYVLENGRSRSRGRLATLAQIRTCGAAISAIERLRRQTDSPAQPDAQATGRCRPASR